MVATYKIVGQNTELELQIKNAKLDSTKARLYNELAWDIKFSNPKKSIEYAENAIQLAHRFNLLEQLSNGYKAKAHGYINQKLFIEGLQLYDTSIYYAKASKNNHLIASVLNKKAGAMGDFGNFDEAILLYTEGLDYALKSNNYKLKSALSNNLADAYQNVNRNTELTQKYFLMAIDFALKNNDNGGASLSSANLAKEYSLQKQYDKAKTELIRALKLINLHPYRDYLYGATHDVISNVYEDVNELKLAQKYAKLSYQILDSLKMPDNLLRPLLVLSSVEFKLGNIIEAKQHTNQMLKLSIERKAKVFIKESYRLLSEIANSEQQYQIALDYYKLYKNWNDSVFAADRGRNIAVLEFKANLEKKEIETQLALKTKENINKKLSSDIFGLKIGIFISLIAFIFLSIIGIMLYKSNKSKQKLNSELIQKNEKVQQQALEKEVLIQEIHHRVKNNLTMLQSLIYLQSKSTNNETVKAVLSESQTRILSMALVHQHLYENDREGSLNLVHFLNNLLNEISSTYSPSNSIQISASGTCDEIGIKTAVPLGLIINELITNSIKYAFNEVNQAIININVSQTESTVEINYSDNGPGLKEKFDEINSGFGFKIIKILSSQIKAKVSYKKESQFSEFTIQFPK